MRFDLKVPCADCPFHKRGRKLRRKHAENILAYRGPFPCHKTVNYVSRDRWKNVDGKAQACAGRLAFELQKTPETQPISLAIRLGADLKKIRAPQDLYRSNEEMIGAQP